MHTAPESGQTNIATSARVTSNWFKRRSDGIRRPVRQREASRIAPLGIPGRNRRSDETVDALGKRSAALETVEHARGEVARQRPGGAPHVYEAEMNGRKQRSKRLSPLAAAVAACNAFCWVGGRAAEESRRAHTRAAGRVRDPSVCRGRPKRRRPHRFGWGLHAGMRGGQAMPTTCLAIAATRVCAALTTPRRL